MSSERIVQLMDELGADIAIHLRQHPTFTALQLAKLQISTEFLYESAHPNDDESCQLPEWSPRPSRVTVLWDRHVRWAAPHRQFLRRCLLGAGIHDDEVAHIWCWPYDSAAPPTEQQVAAMRPLTLKAIEGCNSRHVMLIGTTSVKMWRRELKIGQVQGATGVWDNRWVVYPVTNPLSVMRDPMLQGEWREYVYRFAEMVNDGNDFDHLARKCVEPKCSETVMMYDVDGVPWCNKHYQTGIRRRGLHQGKTQTKTNVTMQERLL